MNPVVEAVARAIYSTERMSPPSDDGWPLVWGHEETWRVYTLKARAAIEALAANVSDEMVEAAGSQIVDSFGNVNGATALASGIRAALSDGQKGGG